MILAINLLLYITIFVSIIIDTLFCYGLFIHGNYLYGSFLTILFVLVIFINILSLYYIHLSKKKEYRIKNFVFVAIFEILSGGVIPGILMLFLNDDHFVNDEIYIDPSSLKKVDDLDYVSKNPTCPSCGHQYNTFDKVCKNCGFILRVDVNKNKPLPLTALETKGCLKTINYEKNRLKDILSNEELNEIKIDSLLYNDYKVNVKSFDIIDGKKVRTFINVKSFYESDINSIFSLNEKEINLLRFHKNFKIHFIYNLDDKVYIRVVDHDNYKKFL